MIGSTTGVASGFMSDSSLDPEEHEYGPEDPQALPW